METDYDDYSHIAEEENDNHFSVLTESDIKLLQNNDINHISSILSISKATSSLLLSHYNWNITQVMESWFDNQQKVQKITGLSSNQSQIQQLGFPISSQIHTCDICFETFSKDDIKSSWCGHPFCIDCWNQYIDTNIDDRNCFELRCPQPSCNAAVDEDMIYQLASESRKIKYDRFLIRSYVETNKNRKLKWCPAPDCGYAIDYNLPDSSSRLNHDVRCLCYHSFCWNCGEEAHAPVDCETVAKWMGKISSDIVISTNTWIIANTKPCPNCKIPIQKNEGCHLMNCRLYYDAWKQIVEGRRILKWADVYGYNLPENENAKIEFFEHIKGMSQVALDKLQHSAETELGKELENGFDVVSVKKYTGVKRVSRETGDNSNQNRNTRRRSGIQV
ncbi:putative E3 ubiquitin-protein ligase ARI7-like protein [Trifolium pratense]|uniref:RBR-type E3 ubiquitin transferase n=1 Tax=Trifolium pratense TaxID=57577 RepID=A0A2K3N2M4_TRIPR|nr:putative E3 ubiquitin-protein ligase ARI7-like protein [Trifolium pratense]